MLQIYEKRADNVVQKRVFLIFLGLLLMQTLAFAQSDSKTSRIAALIVLPQWIYGDDDIMTKGAGALTGSIRVFLSIRAQDTYFL